MLVLVSVGIIVSIPDVCSDEKIFYPNLEASVTMSDDHKQWYPRCAGFITVK
jgi:hypothetical protein